MIGDGSLNSSPSDADRVLGEVERVLAPGGTAAFRLFCAPDQPEDFGSIERDAMIGAAGNIHALKWRIGMMLAASNPDAIVTARAMLGEFNRCFRTAPGWRPRPAGVREQIETLDAYVDADPQPRLFDPCGISGDGRAFVPEKCGVAKRGLSTRRALPDPHPRKDRRLGAAMARLVIVSHEFDIFAFRRRGPGEPIRSPYLLFDLLPYLETFGHSWRVTKGAQPVSGDIAILHVDSTIVGEEYLALRESYARTINFGTGDITKRKVSRNILGPADDWAGPVIVKANFNRNALMEELHNQRAASSAEPRPIPD